MAANLAGFFKCWIFSVLQPSISIFRYIVIEILNWNSISTEMLETLGIEAKYIMLKIHRSWLQHTAIASISVYCTTMESHNYVFGCNRLNYQHFKKPVRLAAKRSKLSDLAWIFLSGVAFSAGCLNFSLLHEHISPGRSWHFRNHFCKEIFSGASKD